MTALVFASTVLAAMPSFILTTVAMDTVHDTLLVGVSAAVAFAVILSTGGWRVGKRIHRLERKTVALAVGGGALAFWAAPLLVLSQRATSAPSGADTLFFTTSLWCVLVVFGAFLLTAEKPAFTAAAGALCSAAGAAGLLASWEYPSSFAPFAKFPVRESLMLFAGVLFAAGVLAIAQSARRRVSQDVVTLSLGGAAAMGVLWSLPRLTTLFSAGAGVLRPCAYLGFTTVVFVVSWVWLSQRVGVARTSAALLLVPVAMTALTLYEAATTVYGQRPFEMRGVLSGSAIVLVGAVVLWLAVPSRAGGRVARGRLARAAVWVAVGSCVVAVVSLQTPALAALSEGHITETFRAQWTMLGFESAAGWMPVVAALLALTAALEAGRRASSRVWVSAALAVLACAVAMPQLAATTLHTWNQWIPATVQQTYGTEYA
ncbi:MAG: hypothetical protein WCI74_09360, partial [Actinomycetes bacterium]